MAWPGHGDGMQGCDHDSKPALSQPHMLKDLLCVLTGVLYDGAQHQPPLELALNLARPGPRAVPRLWAALLEGLACVDSEASGSKAFLQPFGAVPDGSLGCDAWGCSNALHASACTRMALLNCPHYLQAAAKEGKKAEALAAALPQHLAGCLQHEGPPAGAAGASE